MAQKIISKAEDRMVQALDAKVRFEKCLDDEERLGVLIAGWLIPPTEDMPLRKASAVMNEAVLRVAGLNCSIGILHQSMKDHTVAQMAAAYPYVLKKKAEDVNLNVDMNPLEGMSEQERQQLKAFTKTMLKSKLGMGDAD